MPEISASIIVLAGAVLAVASAIPSALTENSRQRIAGMGYMLGYVGAVAWGAAFAMSLYRASQSM